MSVTNTPDVKLDLEEFPESNGESSAPKEEIITEHDVEKQEAISSDQEIETDEAESGDEEVQDAGLVKEDREKPKNDIPRSRLNEEILKKKKERDQKEQYKRENEELRQKLAGNTDTPSIQSQAAPYPEETDDGIDFDQAKLRQARTQWHSNETTRQMDARDADKDANAIKVRNTEKFQDFSSKISDYADKNPEYLEDYQAAGDPSWPQHVTEALMHSEHGVAIDHHLLKNQDVRDRLVKMSPNQALMELGRIENQLTNPQPKKQAKRRQTTAPAPIDQSTGSASGKSGSILDGYDIE